MWHVPEANVSELVVNEVIVINYAGPPYFEGPPQWVLMSDVIVSEVIMSEVIMSEVIVINE